MDILIKTNYINESGFYLVDNNSPKNIDIGDNIVANIFIENMSSPYIINVGKNSKLNFFGFFYNKSPKKILFNQLEDNSILNINIMCYVKGDDLATNIKSFIKSNNSKSNIIINNIIADNTIFIDSCIEVEKDSFKIEADLSQKNIFTSEKGTVRGFPTLLINTSDIKAKHSCQIEKISDDNLFYLNSRGLSKKDASFILIESFFINTFSIIQFINKDLYKKIHSEFLEINK